MGSDINSGKKGSPRAAKVVRKAVSSALLLCSNLLFGTPTPSAPKDDSISKRVAAVRASLSGAQASRVLQQSMVKQAEADAPVQLAQFWGNWPNWGNWNNFANWANWANWGNWPGF